MVNLFIYYIFFLLIIFSFIGYGIIFEKYFNIYEKPVENVFIYLFLGIGFLIIISFLYNFLLLNNKLLNVFFLLFGIYPFFKKINKIKKNANVIIIISSILFIGLIISKPHEDFYAYHYQYISELSENIIKVGLTNLDQKYAYSSIFSYLQSLFNLPYFNLKTVHIPIYVLFISTVGYLFLEILNNKSTKRNICVFILLFIILKYKRLSEFGYDHIANFLILFIFLEFLYKKKYFQNKAIIFFSSIAVLIKVTSMFIIPLLIPLLRKKNLINIKKYISKNLNIRDYVLLIPILIFILNSFLSTGCIFYGFKKSCFDKKKIFWSSDYSKIKYEKNIAEKWAKGYFHSKGKINYNKKKFSENKNWIPNWIDIHFKTRIVKYLSISLILLIFLKWIVFYSKPKKENPIEVWLIFFSIILWFFSIPQLRFGSSFILLFSFYIFSYLLNIGNKIKFKKFLVFFTVVVLYFNLSNVVRIKKEFDRNDYYKFQDFPFISIPNFTFKKFISENNVVYHKYMIVNGDRARSKKFEKNSYSENKIFNLVRLNSNARFYKKYSILYIVNDDTKQ